MDTNIWPNGHWLKGPEALAEDRQWNRIQSSEINPHIHSQLIFNKCAKTIQWGRKTFQKTMLGQLDSYMQKNRVGPLPYTMYKI